MEFKKFDKSQRSTFEYWMWHWLAFNYTACKLKAWKFKYLFHDIEKPWLRLWYLGNYAKVQTHHRTRNKHHLEYKGEKDWEAMVIDWECSRLTKKAAPRTAIGEANDKLLNNEMNYNDYCLFIRTANKLGLEK